MSWSFLIWFVISEKIRDGKAKACEDASWSSEESGKTDQKKCSSRDSTQTPETIDFPRKKDCPVGSSLPATSNNNNNRHPFQQLGSGELTDDGARGDSSSVLDALSGEQENIRASQMGRKDDFRCLEKIDGRIMNVLEGLELYTRVFSFEEQRKIAEFVYDLQDKGRKRQLIGIK